MKSKEEKMKRRNGNSLLEVLNIVGSLIMVGLLLTMLYFSFVYWQNNFPATYDISVRMFYVSIGVVIVTVTGQWIEGRVRSIINSINRLKGGNS